MKLLFIQFYKFSFWVLTLIVERYNNKGRWNTLIRSIQKTLNPSFRLPKSSIRIRIPFFNLDFFSQIYHLHSAWMNILDSKYNREYFFSKIKQKKLPNNYLSYVFLR